MDVDLTNMEHIKELEDQARELGKIQNKMNIAYDNLADALLNIRMTKKYRKEIL